MSLLTTRDVQELIRVDRSTIYRMAEDGRLPAVLDGDLDPFIEDLTAQEQAQALEAIGEAE